jgi:exopolysaccharide production protein ExoZ
MKFELVQVLRAVAAIAVVLFHAAGATLKYSPTPAASYPLWQAYGAWGVDLFFVISGFVIFHSGRGLPARAFAARRLGRIVPIYWILTLLAAAIAAAGLAASIPSTPERLLASLGFVTFLQGGPPLLHVGWTLEFEVFFYVVTAGAIALARRPWTLAVAVLCALVAAGAALAPQHPAAVFATHPLLLEFVAGVLVGQACARQLGKVEVACFASAVLALVALGSPAVLGPLLVATLLVAAAVRFDRPAPRWAVRLGDASYSIYLVQVFTVPLVAKAMRAAVPGHHPELLLLAATAATVLAGLVSYWLLERPVARLLRAPRSAPPAVPA